MSKRTEALQNTRILDHITTLSNVLTSGDNSQLGPSDQEDLNRLRKILNYLQSGIKDMDVELLQQEAFSKLSGYATQLLNAANSSKDRTTGVILTQALQGAENALNVVGSYFKFKNPNITLMEVNDENVKMMKASLESFTAKTQQIETKIAETGKVATASAAKVNQMELEFQQKRTAADTSITELRRSVSESIASNNQTFSDAIKQSKLDAQNQIKDNQKLLKDQTDEAKKHHVAVLEATKKDSEEHLKQIKNTESEITKIFEASGNKAQSGDLKNVADYAQKLATRWSLVSFICFAAMAVMGTVVILAGLKEHDADSWKYIAIRIGQILLFLPAGLYAAQESAKHRRTERYNRKFQLELATINPYLAQFPVDKQIEIKSKLAEKFFGVSEPVEPTESVSKKDLIELATDLAKAAASKEKSK